MRNCQNETCNTHLCNSKGEKRKTHVAFLVVKPGRKRPLEDVAKERRMVNWVLNRMTALDWIYLVKNRDKWRTLASTVKKVTFFNINKCTISRVCYCCSITATCFGKRVPRTHN